MKFFVTAGNTQTPIDRVRCITNIFSGKTGTKIALTAAERTHQVVLATSHPELVSPGHDNLLVTPYRTFPDLSETMRNRLTNEHFDVVIHCAAVSDYEIAGVFCNGAGTAFDPKSQSWNSSFGPPTLDDVRKGKVKSSFDELWLRLTPTPKLIDLVRSEWQFQGFLVKFKLEVDVSEEELKRIAAQSRTHSKANLIVANTLEGMHDWAVIGDHLDRFVRVRRSELALRLIETIELAHR